MKRMEYGNYQSGQGTAQPIAQGYTIPPMQQPKPAKKRSPIWIILTILFVLTSLALGVLCAMEYRKTQDLSADLDARDEKITKLESDLEADEAALERKEKSITDYKKTVASLTADVQTYKSEADKLDDVLTFLLRADAGQASSNFKADKSIIVMHKNDPMTTFRLTTGYNTTYGFNYSVYGVVDVDFNKNSWRSTSTQIIVTPTGVGTTLL